MKNRILKGWTIRRILYLSIGIATIVMAFMYHDWMIGIVGAYFASMGLFAFGCASGNCFTGTCSPDYSARKRTAGTEPIQYEEIK